MPMNILQMAADRLGFLVYALDQSDTPPMRQPQLWGDVAGGYCVGLTTRWIALRYAAHDYPFDRATKICAVPDGQAARDHNVHGQAKKASPAPFPDKYKVVFGQYGLHLNHGVVTAERVAMSGQTLVRQGLRAEGCHFIRMAGTAGAHAVAMVNQGSHGWRFFDPNFGHFRLPDTNAFEAFITWFMKHSNYAVDDYLARAVEIVHVNPPPFTGAAFAAVMKILTDKLER